MTLIERIKAAFEDQQDRSEMGQLGDERDWALAKAARELLPLALAEMERLGPLERGDWAMMPIERVRDRYDHDAEFRIVVDTLMGIILKLEMTPSEVREAAMFACIRVEERFPRPMTFRYMPGDNDLSMWLQLAAVTPFKKDK